MLNSGGEEPAKAIVAYYYKVSKDNALREEAKKANIDGDEEIDLQDLAIIASAILGE